MAGPTAVGKTAVAIAIAQHYQTAVVSADSRQIFREMTIGTAKPSPDELAAVPHYFINSHSIHEPYDAARYGVEALAQIHTLFEQHDVVVLCGGSGLYIRAVVDGFDDIPDIDEGIRADILQSYAQHGLAWLQARMAEEDPEQLRLLDVNNPQRLMRALEVKRGTGQSIRTFQKQQRLQHDFQVVRIALDLPREALYQRIDQRMDAMIADGLFEEARELYPYKHINALQTVGYQEIFDYMDGLYDRAEAIRLLKRNSRHYAKRQLTWFRRDTAMTWKSPYDVKEIIDYIETREA